MSAPADPHAALVGTAGGVADGALRTADGRPLKTALAASQARAKRRAFLLVAPLLAFVLVTFVVPIGQMLMRSIDDPRFIVHVDKGTGERTPIMTRTREWLAATEPGTAPDEAAFAALATDLADLKALRAQGDVGTRINYDASGARSLFTSGARRAERLEPPYREAMLELDADWGDPALWQAMRGAASRYTANFYLAAVDRQRAPDGTIERVPEERRVYLMLFERTLILSLVITGLTLVLGFPVAHLCWRRCRSGDRTC